MKRLIVVSHKVCWPSSASPSGYASDGGFPMQMRAISELFDETTLLLPCAATEHPGGMPLAGANLQVRPLSLPRGQGWRRKAAMPAWFAHNLPKMLFELRSAYAVHTPIPGDIGTLGMMLAKGFRKRLFVRHCGNWFVQRTTAERFWKWFMERFAGGRNVMLATGGASSPPSSRNSSLRWIFSSTLTEEQLADLATRRRFNSHPSRIIIVCRQYVGKGTERIIQSLPLLQAKVPNIKLDVVGAGSGLETFQQLARQLGVQSSVEFHGQQPHDRVLELLQKADLFCYPTASDGFPKVVIEAMACGLPIVTTKVSVLPHLLSTGGGVLLDGASPHEIAESVAECLLDPNRLRLMSVQAMQIAKQYSLERWRDEIGALLSEAWEAPRR